jgi:hypothetical protein
MISIVQLRKSFPISIALVFVVAMLAFFLSFREETHSRQGAKAPPFNSQRPHIWRMTSAQRSIEKDWRLIGDASMESPQFSRRFDRAPIRAIASPRRRLFRAARTAPCN